MASSSFWLTVNRVAGGTISTFPVARPTAHEKGGAVRKLTANPAWTRADND
jgi:hypothetical protein